MANPAGNRSRRTLRRGNINAAIARRRDRHSAVTGGTEPLEEINLVGSWRKENAKDSADSIFANNPFFDELLEWRGSPEG
jgi:hypothetical protein